MLHPWHPEFQFVRLCFWPNVCVALLKGLDNVHRACALCGTEGWTWWQHVSWAVVPSRFYVPVLDGRSRIEMEESTCQHTSCGVSHVVATVTTLPVSVYLTWLPTDLSRAQSHRIVKSSHRSLGCRISTLYVLYTRLLDHGIVETGSQSGLYIWSLQLCFRGTIVCNVRLWSCPVERGWNEHHVEALSKKLHVWPFFLYITYVEWGKSNLFVLVESKLCCYFHCLLEWGCNISKSSFFDDGCITQNLGWGKCWIVLWSSKHSYVTAQKGGRICDGTILRVRTPPVKTYIRSIPYTSIAPPYLGRPKEYNGTRETYVRFSNRVCEWISLLLVPTPTGYRYHEFTYRSRWWGVAQSNQVQVQRNFSAFLIYAILLYTYIYHFIII